MGNTDETPISIRLDPRLRERVERAAAESRRSRSAQIVLMLEEWLDLRVGFAYVPVGPGINTTSSVKAEGRGSGVEEGKKILVSPAVEFGPSVFRDPMGGLGKVELNEGVKDEGAVQESESVDDGGAASGEGSEGSAEAADVHERGKQPRSEKGKTGGQAGAIPCKGCGALNGNHFRGCSKK